MKLTRREFLKSASLYALGSLGTLAQPGRKRRKAAANDRPNIIILLFDALSARNMSLYGYPRQTTPHIARFAERATVYHRHYAAGNFTSPSTASLLTGTYPWTHRAFQQAGLIRRTLADHNLFQLLDGAYERVAFTQNIWVDLFLYQFRQSLDVHVKSTAYSLDEYIRYNDGVWQNDPLIAFRSHEDFLEQDFGIPGSLYFSLADKVRSYLAHKFDFRELRDEYPRGIPNFSKYKAYFMLEQVFEGVAQELIRLREPFAGYFHLWPPHEPYLPNRHFIGLFDDGWSPVRKPPHTLSNELPEQTLDSSRREYDEFVSHVDHEFGQLYDRLQTAGLLENSYLIVTSDHGEMFERGVRGHVTPLLYDPVIHVPLLISAPGQSARRDIHSLTSCVDLVPTLLNFTANPAPDWLEGTLLPGFGGEENAHPVFTVEAKKNPAASPLTQATFAMLEGDYKLILYFGYPGYEDVCELYNLREDPEELNDLGRSRSVILDDMKSHLQFRLAHSDRPFHDKN